MQRNLVDSVKETVENLDIKTVAFYKSCLLLANDDERNRIQGNTKWDAHQWMNYIERMVKIARGR